MQQKRSGSDTSEISSDCAASSPTAGTKRRRNRAVPLVSIAATCLLAVTSLVGTSDARTTNDPFRHGRIAFEVTDQSTGDVKVVISNPDGSRARPLPVPFAAGRPRWSQDGKRLLLFTFSDHGVRPSTVRPDGTDFNLLPVKYFPPDVDVGLCIWAKSDRIVCEARRFEGDSSLNGIYSMRSTDGGDIRRLTINPFPASSSFGGGDEPGSVSPDGTKFVFKRAKPGPGPIADQGQSGALFVANIDGSGLRQITDYGIANSHDEGVARWSPDGENIVFGGEDGAIYLIHPNGRHLKKIKLAVADNHYFAFAPGWSPDGSRLVFGLGLPSVGQVDLYTAKVDGSALHRITNSPEFDDSPDWSNSQS